MPKSGHFFVRVASCRAEGGFCILRTMKWGAQGAPAQGIINRRLLHMKIGLIGLGIMGKPMAKNLLKAGYTDLLVSDLNQAAVDEVVAAGATAATQPEIGASCDVVQIGRASCRERV